MSRAGRPVSNMDDWMRDIERRLTHQERRPPTPTAASLLGPGFAPHAVKLLDWNSATARFNGFWYGENAYNSPEGETGTYLGVSVATADGHVLQVAVKHEPDLRAPNEVFARRIHTHSTQAPQFSDWEQITPAIPEGGIIYWPDEDPTPVGWQATGYPNVGNLRPIARQYR